MRYDFPSNLGLSTCLFFAWITVAFNGSLRGQPPITALAVLPYADQYVTGSQAGLAICQWPTMEIREQLPTRLEHIHDLALSHDGQILMAAGGVPAEQGVIELWDWPSRQLMQSLEIGSDLVYRAAWFPADDRFITAVANGPCEIWTRAGQRLTTYRGHSRSVLALAVLPSQSRILSAGVDQTIQLWSTASATRERGLDNHTDAVLDLALQPGPARAANDHATQDRPAAMLASVSEDKTVRLWQPMIGRMVRFVRLTTVPRRVLWSVDGSRIIVACDNGQVLVLDPSDMQTVRSYQSTVQPIFELCLGGASGRIAVAGAGGVEFFSLQ